jgi:hypothetical protein
MRGCEPVAITRGCDVGPAGGAPGTRGCVVLLGGGIFGSSFATVRGLRLAPPKGGSAFTVA